MGLQAQLPVAGAPGSTSRPARCSRRRPGRPSAERGSSRSPGARTLSGSTPPWGYTNFSSWPPVDDQVRADLGADAEPVDAGRRGTRAVGLDRDVEAPRHAAPSTAASSSCSSGSPPVQTTMRSSRPPYWPCRLRRRRPGRRRLRTGRRPGRRCRRSRCRRTCRSPVPGPSRGRSTGCTRLNRQNTAGRPA